jgi:light-regulated signal transduction histidine kinase (bacteriophytochrome)
MKKPNYSEKLDIANKKLGVQKQDKAKRAEELLLANKELKFQNKEKEKRAKELIIANKELKFQNKEKEKRAKELLIANKELKFQNKEKEKRAAELLVANKELELHFDEKEKRAAELAVANDELAFQNSEKEKRANELININKQLASQKQQLEDFCNVISHNLRAPLVNISMLVDFITESTDESEKKELSDKLNIATNLLNEIFTELIESLQIKQDDEIASKPLHFEEYIQRTCDGLMGQITKLKATFKIDVSKAPELVYPEKYLSSILHNLISNALKYSAPNRPPVVSIKTKKIKDSIFLSVTDNGLGMDLIKHKDNLFKIRKVFHQHPDAKGFGLFITKTQIEAMGGRIWIESTVGKSTTFWIEFKNQTS